MSSSPGQEGCRSGQYNPLASRLHPRAARRSDRAQLTAVAARNLARGRSGANLQRQQHV